VRETLNRVLFWLFIAPLFLICAAVVPLAVEAWTSPGRFAIAVVWVAFSLMAALVIYDPRRFWVGMRVFAALLFVGLAANLVREFFFGGSSPAMALLNFLHVGLPGLAYAIWGPRDKRRDADASGEAKG